MHSFLVLVITDKRAHHNFLYTFGGNAVMVFPAREGGLLVPISNIGPSPVPGMCVHLQAERNPVSVYLIAQPGKHLRQLGAGPCRQT